MIRSSIREGIAPSQRHLATILTSLALLASCSGGAGAPGEQASSSEASGGPPPLGASDDFKVINIYGPAGGPFAGGDRTYSIRNTTGEPVTYRVDADEPWLAFEPNSGSLESRKRLRFTVTPDPVVAAQLPVGIYTSTLLFENSRGAYPQVQFRLNVHDPSYGDLEVTPAEDFVLTMNEGSVPDPEYTSWVVGNVGTGILMGAASLDAEWVQFASNNSWELPEGSENAIRFQLDAGALGELPAGTHEAVARFENTDDPTDFEERTIRVVVQGSGSDDSGRVTEGLLSLYTFEEAAGDQVRDISNLEVTTPLEIADPSAVTWLPGALRINEPTIIQTASNASSLSGTLQASNEVTLEAWITPDSAFQDGPARILTLSGGSTERNFTLGQGYWGDLPADAYSVRLRSSATDLNGLPATGTGGGVAQQALQHVVYTRSASGATRLYVDGELIESGNTGGDLVNWSSSYSLAIGNEFGGGRPWLGTLHLVAIFNRALSAAEVQKNFDEGTGDSAAGFLSVDPDGEFRPVATLSTGEVVPATKAYQLSNLGGEVLQWSVSTSGDWMLVEGAQSGLLQPGDSHELVVKVDEEHALGLAEGWYEGRIDIQNQSSGYGSASRDAQLWVREDAIAGGDNNAGMRSSLTRNGITWYFDQPYLTGQFVNGDWWVLDDGSGVKVTSVSPAPQWGRNGSMFNPVSGACNGFDDRTVCYDPALSASYPVSMSGGDSLLSTASHQDNNSHVDLLGMTVSADHGPIERAAALTCVDDEMPGSAFRPPVVGNHRPIYDTGQIRHDRLPNLPATGGAISFEGNLPGSSKAQKLAFVFEQLHLHVNSDWMDRMTHPTQNQPNYHREAFTVTGDALTVMISDEPDREVLMVPLLQAGIDMYWSVISSEEEGRPKPPSSVHKGLIIFSGLLLDDPGMASPPGAFRTQWMSYNVAEGVPVVTSNVVAPGYTWHGHPWAWRQDPGLKEHEHLHPSSEWGTNAPWGQVKGHIREVYRGINSRSWAAIQLTMLSMEGGYELYDHPPFFHYVDRWMGMTQDWAPHLQTINNSGYTMPYNQGDCASAFQKNMWLAHRASFDY